MSVDYLFCYSLIQREAQLGKKEGIFLFYVCCEQIRRNRDTKEAFLVRCHDEVATSCVEGTKIPPLYSRALRKNRLHLHPAHTLPSCGSRSYARIPIVLAVRKYCIRLYKLSFPLRWS